MRKLIKFTLRTTVLGGFALAALAAGSHLIAGPERTRAVVDQIRENVHSAIDHNISDPVALRRELRDLEGTYPKRIAELTSDLSEVRQHVAKVTREQAVSDRVVELADRDLEVMEKELAALNGTEGGMRSASTSIEIEQRRHDMVLTTSRMNQTRQTRIAYATRSSETDRELEFLGAQEQRLTEALAQLETEHAQFQAQLSQIERQVDAIERNKHLIAMMEKRQKALDEIGRYEAVSLDHLVGRLAEVRNHQEAQLDVLSKASRQQSYEEMAEMQLQIESEANGALESEPEFDGQLLELTPVIR